MTGRWWDGCDRAVVEVRTVRLAVTKRAVDVLVLACGHMQSAGSGSPRRDAAICLECARLGKREAA